MEKVIVLRVEKAHDTEGVGQSLVEQFSCLKGLRSSLKVVSVLDYQTDIHRMRLSDIYP